MTGYTLTTNSETRVEGREVVVWSPILAAHWCRRVLLIGRRGYFPQSLLGILLELVEPLGPVSVILPIAQLRSDLRHQLSFRTTTHHRFEIRVKAEEADTPVLCKKTWANGGANGLAHTSEWASLEWGSKLSACLTGVRRLPFCKALLSFLEQLSIGGSLVKLVFP